MPTSNTQIGTAQSAHDRAIVLVRDAHERDLNEANTRHQVIDEVLHGILSWPRNLTKVESLIDPGFADYCLHREDDSLLIVVEAKRAGMYFKLPDADSTRVTSRNIRVKTLTTDPGIRDAISQVHTYCVNAGCPFGAITNGYEWILFRTFQSSQDWRNLQAFVIPSLDYFAERFTDAVNTLGYRAIAELGSLSQLLGLSPLENREVFYPKQGIIAYSTSIYQNKYAQQLRPIVERYFQQLERTPLHLSWSSIALAR